MSANRPDYYKVLDRLGLDSPPIGVKYEFFKPEGMQQLEADTRLSLCEIFRKCQTENRPFYFSRDNNETCVGKVMLGMEDMESFAESGQIGARLGVFNDPRANRHIYQYISKLDKDTVNYVSFSPVSQIDFDPDVLVISASSAQAEIIMRASAYSTGEPYTSSCTPVIGCSWFLIYPFKTGKINYILTDLVHGLHGRELYPSGTVLISIPYRWIPAVIENLSTMELHLPSHEGKQTYYSEFEGILSDLARASENP